MRKFIAFALIVAAVMCAGIAFADDGEKLKIDDVTFGKAYKIKGYAAVTFKEFSFIDSLYISRSDNIYSGAESDMAYLAVDMRNLAKKEAKFLGTISIRVVYDDEYEYNGFVKQSNYDDNGNHFNGEFAIYPMYTGHYGFFCTLPNYIVQDKSAPLRMTITINGHEFTYHIRK